MSSASVAFTAQCMTLGSLLSGTRTFTIPSFQRSYSWTSREVAQLLTDLWFGIGEAHERAAAYNGLFLGSLVVVDANGSSGKPPAPFQIIDGKQRLTTLTILLAALRDRLGQAVPWIGDLLSHVDNPEKPNLLTSRLTLEIEERTYFDVQVQRNGATQEPVEPDEDAPGSRGIRECQLTILEDCEDRSDEDLQALANFLRDEVVIALIAAPDMDTAYRVFLSTNHRGKPLTSTDILKAELMSEVPEAQRDDTLERWRTMERLLDRDFDLVPGLLQTLLGSRQAPQIRGVLAISRSHGGAVPFLNDTLFPLGESLYPILHATHMGSPLSEAINRNLRLLGWLKARDWVAPLVAFYQKYPNQPEQLARFVAALERLAFVMQISGTGGDQREARYRNVIEAIRSGSANEGAVGPLAINREDQEALLAKANGSLYRRSAATCKYLLKRISAIDASDITVESLTDVSVEHVLPTNISNNSPWLQVIPNADERAACNRLLGNLVLISRQQNKDAKNQGFQAKLRVYFPAGQASPHAITNDLLGATSWTAQDIRSRDAALMSKLRSLVGIPPDVGPGRRKKKGKTA
jgi:hypothetical protein